MSADPSILIIGHSHVFCFEAAFRTGKIAGDVECMRLPNQDPEPVPVPTSKRIVNGLTRRAKSLVSGGKPDQHKVDQMRSPSAEHVPPLVATRAQSAHPDAVCLCLRGNFHNVIGILEHPSPFALGTTSGVAPDAPDRHFIPSAMMRRYFQTHDNADRVAAIYAAFPAAKRFYINVPPPIQDFGHISKNPGVFGEKLHLGPAPDALRLELYEMQSEMYRRLAMDHDARFIDVHPSLIDQGGFLERRYYSNDPTHGNHAYGNVMLKNIIAQVRAAT